MKDDHINSLINNEKEWRRYIIHQIDQMERDHDDMRELLSGLKVWNRVWRGVGAAVMSIILLILQFKLK